MHSQDGTVNSGGAPFEFGSATGNRRAGSKPKAIKASPGALANDVAKI